MKKFVSVLLALAMTLALSVSALAAAQDGTLTGGSITINDAVPGQTYSVYQILYLESYNDEAHAYSYKANSEWKTWLEKQTAYINIDEQGYVTWVGDQTAERAQAFAKLAQKELANKTAAATATAPAAATGATYSTISFKDLKLGYYLIDTTLGTLCSLDTTNPNVVMQEKNEVPTNVKTVEEDSTGTYGPTNDADIGQTVNFKSTITAQAGAENYVFHDKMSAGLTFGSVTGVTLNGKTVDAATNYTVKTSGFAENHDCTFEVIFTQTFCNTLKANDKIVISYTATVNEDAVIGGNGNLNESKVEYGESGKTTTTPPSTTTTYTWKIDVFKYTVVKATEEGKEDTEKGLANAQFVLYKMVNGVKNYAIVDANNKITGWTTNAYNSAEAMKASVIITPDDGTFTITGLDSDTYYLEEIVAPAGYNVLSGPVTVVINDKGEVTYNGTSTGTVKVLNQSGTELPSTGGMGTTIFYVLGGVLMAGAFVLLVVRKRMRTE